jgi:MFS transporter, DHA3 family, macrolide efflux protein
MTPTAEQMSLRQVLAMPSVRRLWFGQLVSIFGDFLALFAVISVVSFRLHGTAAQITGISLAYIMPLAFFGPLAGVFVDRWNVKTTMITSDLARGLLALSLVFVHSLWGIYAIFFAISLLSSFFTPAQSVTVRALVPREGLMSANALMMQAMQITRIISPAAAGTIVASFGAESCFYIDAASFFFSAFMLSGIAIHRAPAQAAAGVRNLLKDLFSGMRFIFTHAAITFVILAMGAGMFAMSCFGPLIALYVRDFLSSGTVLFGALNSLIGVGMIVGTLLLRRIAAGHRKEMVVLAGLLTVGVSTVLIAGIPVAALTAVGMFSLGFGVALIITPAQALFQQETPIAMVGRVSSSVMSVITFSQIIGLAISGSFAGMVGVRNVFFACAALLAAITLFGYSRIRSQKAIPDQSKSSAA